MWRVTIKAIILILILIIQTTGGETEVKETLFLFSAGKLTRMLIFLSPRAGGARRPMYNIYYIYYIYCIARVSSPGYLTKSNNPVLQSRKINTRVYFP